MARGRRKRERYVDRWKRERRRVEFWLTKEEYVLLEKAMSRRGKAVKDLVLEALKCLESEYKPGFEEGYEQALKDFVDKPHLFYENARKLAAGYVALFTLPCPLCGETIIFTHKLDSWPDVFRLLVFTFGNYAHAECPSKTRTPSSF